MLTSTPPLGRSVRLPPRIGKSQRTGRPNCRRVRPVLGLGFYRCQIRPAYLMLVLRLCAPLIFRGKNTRGKGLFLPGISPLPQARNEGGQAGGNQSKKLQILGVFSISYRRLRQGVWRR